MSPYILNQNCKFMKTEIVKEFKEFALKGNVFDMAIGIIIGVAFGKIVSSLVTDIIMPPIGLIVGGVNFSELKLIMKQGVGNSPDVTLNYGNFIQVTFDFLIVAVAVFILVKALNASTKKKVESIVAHPAPSKELETLVEIKELLRKKCKEE